MKNSPTPSILAKSSSPAAPSQVEVQTAVFLFQQRRFAEVEQVAHKLIKQYPQHGFGWKVLGVALKETGRFQESVHPMQTAAKLNPKDFEIFNNLGGTWQELGNVEYADACYRQALEIKPDAIVALGNLSDLLVREGKGELALPFLQRKLALQPDDQYTQHLIAMLTGQTSERAPDQYVARTFDHYAKAFESHLQSDLQYKAPEQLVDLIKQINTPAAKAWRVLDLGCGTGLVGAAMAPFASEIVGVDLSPKMLEKAQAKNLYQRLVCEDLLTMMRAEQDASYDVITSADVFIYIGKLDDVTKEAKRLLKPGGQLVFSIETIDATQPGHSPAQDAEPDYQLKKSGRYGQSLAYLAKLAADAGFKVVQQQAATIRTEAGVPVSGYLVAWQA